MRAGSLLAAFAARRRAARSRSRPIPRSTRACKNLEEELRCLVCQNQTLADSERAARRRPAPRDPRARRRRQERRRDQGLPGRALRRLRALQPAGQAQRRGSCGSVRSCCSPAARVHLVGRSRAGATRRERRRRLPSTRAAATLRGRGSRRPRAAARQRARGARHRPGPLELTSDVDLCAQAASSRRCCGPLTTALARAGVTANQVTLAAASSPSRSARSSRGARRSAGRSCSVPLWMFLRMAFNAHRRHARARVRPEEPPRRLSQRAHRRASPTPRSTCRSRWSRRSRRCVGRRGDRARGDQRIRRRARPAWSAHRAATTARWARATAPSCSARSACGSALAPRCRTGPTWLMPLARRRCSCVDDRQPRARAGWPKRGASA